MTKPVVLISKLGTARRVPKSRIWIEGKRLVDAGFTVGKYFHKGWGGGFTECTEKGLEHTLVLTLAKDSDVCTEMPCKVSGKGEKPIIDITGEMVRKAFGAGYSHVRVTFKPGVITIKGHA